MASAHFDGISHRRPGEFDALVGFDLHIADGELVALTGGPGSGAATALRILAGLEDPEHGTIRIGGHDVTRLAPRDRGVALVLPHHGLYTEQTVVDHLRFPLIIGGAANEICARRVGAVAEQLGLEDVLDCLPGDLGIAQRHRVAVGRAIVRRPEVLLMDEPLSGLDADERAVVCDEIARGRERVGTTIVAVVADRFDALLLADRTVGFDRGRATAASPSPVPA